MGGPGSGRKNRSWCLEREQAEKNAAHQREQKRIADQRDAFDCLPEGPVRDHLRDMMLQRAYDLLWKGEAEACDALCEFLHEDDAKAMLDAWLDDQLGDTPKSKWH